MNGSAQDQPYYNRQVKCAWHRACIDSSGASFWHECDKEIDIDDDVSRWVAAHPLTPAHVDCATAVMLKILDGKCRMDAAEKVVMAQLYDAAKGREGLLLGAEIHALIAQARSVKDAELRELIYEKRVLAETMISRPVMKGFKARIREQGLFFGRANSGEKE